MDAETSNLLIDALAVLVLLLSPLLLMIALRVVRYLGKMANVKDLQIAEWCVRQGILLIEDLARKRVMSSEEKKKLAREKAREHAPDGLKKLPDSKVDDLLEAQLTLLKPSIRPPSLPSLRPLDMSSVPSIPPAPAVPRSSLFPDET